MATILDAYADFFRGPSPDAIRREKLRRQSIGLLGRIAEDVPDIAVGFLGILFMIVIMVIIFVPWFVGAGTLWYGMFHQTHTMLTDR